MTWTVRAGGLSGVVGALLIAVGALLTPNPPDMNATLQSITAYLSAHHSAMRVGQVLTMLGALCLLAFVAQLAAGDRSTPGAATIMAGAAAAVLLWTQSATFLMLAAITAQNMDGGLRGLYDLGQLLAQVALVADAALLAALGGLILSGRTLPSWLAWIALLLALILVLAAVIGAFAPSVAQGGAHTVLLVLFSLGIAVAGVLALLRVTEAQPADPEAG